MKETLSFWCLDRMQAILARPLAWGDLFACECQLLLLVECWWILQGASLDDAWEGHRDRYKTFLSTQGLLSNLPLAHQIQGEEQFCTLFRTYLDAEIARV